MVRAVRKMMGPRVLGARNVEFPHLPPALTACGDGLAVELGIAISPAGNTDAVLFLGGDGRCFELVRDTVGARRWRTLNARGTDGVLLRLRCEWRKGKPFLQSFSQTERVGTGRSPFSVDAERTGIESWLSEVRHIGWTDWYRVLLSLNPDGSVAQAKLVEGDGVAGQTAVKAAEEWKFRESSHLPKQLTLSLASADGKPFVRYGVLRVGGGNEHRPMRRFRLDWMVVDLMHIVLGGMRRG